MSDVLHLTGKLLAQRHEPGRPVPVELVCRGQTTCDLIHVSACCLDAGSRFHSSDDVDESPAALAPWSVPVELQRDPRIVVVIHKPELRRHHAHDLCRSVVELDKAAHDVSIAAEPRLPQAMTDDGHIGRIRAIVVLVDRAAEDRFNTEHWKELRRDRLHSSAASLHPRLSGSQSGRPPTPRPVRAFGCRAANRARSPARPSCGYCCSSPRTP